MSQTSRIRKTLCVFWLCSVSVCIGLNWTALQLVAWVGMTITNARTMDLSAAAEKATEGRQVCVVCRLLSQGKKTESDSLWRFHYVSEVKAVFEDNQFVLNPMQGFKICVGSFVCPVTDIDLPPTPPPEKVA